MRFIPAPVSTISLALPPSLRCNTIDNNLPVVVHLTLGTFLLDSPLFGLLEMGSFLGWRMEDFESNRSRLCAWFVNTWDILVSCGRLMDGWKPSWLWIGSISFRYGRSVNRLILWAVGNTILFLFFPSVVSWSNFDYFVVFVKRLVCQFRHLLRYRHRFSCSSVAGRFQCRTSVL